MRTTTLMLLLFMATIPSCKNSSGPKEISGSWELVREQQGDIIYNSIHFADTINGWLAGQSGTIEYSSDGGDTWNSQQSGVSSDLYDIDFVDSQKGWICGSNKTILKTVDGGDSWSCISSGTSSDPAYTLIEFVTDEIGWMSSAQGDILRTTVADYLGK